MYKITIKNEATGRELTREYNREYNIEEYNSDEELGEMLRDMISRVNDLNLSF